MSYLAKHGGPRLVYMAHPVGAPTVAGVKANVERARRWFAWLLSAYPGDAIQAPWVNYLDALADDVAEDRSRGMRDNLAAVRRCDVIVLCGGRISPGMADELAVAKECGLVTIDLIGMGDEPPAAGRS